MVPSNVKNVKESSARQEKEKDPAATYSPTANRSTIGVRVLNFRVRDGNGCVHPAVATGSIPTLRCMRFMQRALAVQH